MIANDKNSSYNSKLLSLWTEIDYNTIFGKAVERLRRKAIGTENVSQLHFNSMYSMDT